MDSLSDLIIKRAEMRGLGKVFTATTILEAAKRVMPVVAMPKIYKDGVLTVEVATDADAYFFKQDCEDYLERINAALPKDVVKTIKVRIKR